MQALRDVGYESPSLIQEQGIPPLLEGRDMIGQAQTGSGKTAAFAAAARIRRSQRPRGSGTRPDPDASCIQVTQAIRACGARKGVDVVAASAARRSAPNRPSSGLADKSSSASVGRVRDLISRHSLMLNQCRFLVLDEADEMLDLGFFEDVEKIIAWTPGSRQTALFSATIPPEIRRLADKYLLDPVTVQVQVQSAALTVDSVEKKFFVETKRDEKVGTLERVLKAENPTQAIVFVRTKIRCDQLLPHPARPRPGRQGAPRRHVAGVRATG